ncbi:SGS-domain-containing protein [Sporormia fimetaria CBS 119925]|uniref:SGS-domain-containing protein n=1 Tax=Sporormia fimetaria CBS 119925 TaxID=1340428 RepID=A0A6A6V1R0_9PLEO|nr:SGS-domain-containing protein [Sporormia fimetaria CBS 119925]
MDQAKRGAAALEAGDYGKAVEEYSAAISVNPVAAPYYIKRSQAYHRTGKFAEALADAEVGLGLARQRGNRELIKEAQLRRATTMYHTKRYGDAIFLLDIIDKMSGGKDNMAGILRTQAKMQMDNPDVPEEAKKCTIEEFPQVALPTADQDRPKQDTGKDISEQNKQPAVVKPTPADKIKVDFFEGPDTATVVVMAKGVPKDKLTVEIEKHAVHIAFPLAEGKDFNYTADPLFGPVVPSESTYRMTPNKIEIKLKKAGKVRWKALEGSTATSSGNSQSLQQLREELKAKPEAVDAGPAAYPTSSKKGPKNWDKIVEETSSEEKKKDKFVDSDDEGDETTKFFRQLYKGATPEQQRAMMKSFTESGGTVLSTDWSNVGSNTVNPEPPEGMQANKW